jgi:uncharacterized repeat protein (TIGR01451 family)
MWCVSPGIIQVINGRITGAYDIHPAHVVDGQTFIKSLLGGTYCTNLAAEPGRAIQERFIEPDSVTVKQLPRLVDMEIVKTVEDDTLVMGDMAHFTVTLNNLGPSRGTSVVVMDVLPDELGFDSYTASQGWYDVTSGYWSVGDLASDNSATLEIWATVNTVGEVCNRATVVSLDQHDSVTTNNSSEVCLDAAPADPSTLETLDLDDGLNLISLPLIPDDYDDPQTALSGLNVGTVNRYDKSTENWVTYINGDPSGGYWWRDGIGYWITMGSPADDIPVNGVELKPYPDLPPSYEVFGKDSPTYNNGWNLIGFKSTTAKLPSEYLAGIEGKFVMIYGFDNGAFHAVGSPGHAMLQPGFGYWLAVKDGESGTIFP